MLTVPSGVTYAFNTDGSLASVSDLFGNTITVNYASGKISTIVDTIGRVYTFAYDPNQGGNLKTITYASGKTVTYGYLAGALGYSLVSVTDPVGRITQYTYANGLSQYILNQVQYATGGRTTYSFGARFVGSDSWEYLVISQAIYAGPNPADLVRSNSFEYRLTYGRVGFARVHYFDSFAAEQGHTDYVFDKTTGSVDTRLYDVAGVQLRRTRSWYATNGAVSSQESFVGAAARPSFSSLAGYDDWGNAVYTREPSGHETFATFANTRTQNAFRAPGRFDLSSSGLLLQDDFSDRDTNGWSLAGFGSFAIDEQVFLDAPPSIRLEAPQNNYEDMGRTFADVCTQQSAFVEFRVRPGEIADWHDLIVAGASGNKARLRFGANGEIQYETPPNGGDFFTSFSPAVQYAANTWYRIGIACYRNEGTGELKWDFWPGGKLGQSGIRAILPWSSCGVDAAGFQVASLAAPPVRLWVGEVTVSGSRQVTVTGLVPGQAVRLRSREGAIVGQAKVPTGATAVAVPSPSFPHGRLEVLGVDMALETESPFVEVFGGDAYAYRTPWSLEGLTRTTNGFATALSTTTVFLDDALPPASGGTEPWIWIVDGKDGQPLPVSGSKTHLGTCSFSAQNHWFTGGAPTYPFSYLLQFVHVASGESPEEVSLQYRTCPVGQGCVWTDHAYWGVNHMPGPYQSMGALPDRRDQWLMLVLATSAFDPVSDAIDGIEFGRFGGNSTWDFSASRGTNPDGIGGPGMIAVTGLATGGKVDLLAKNGNVKASATAGASGFVNLDLYAANIRAFPMRGQFRVYSPGPTLEYVSPMFENLWGGDKFAYGNPGFYPNGDLLTVSSTVHNRAIGTLEFQTGRGASPQVPQKIFTKYDGLGFSVETKRSHNAAWISTSRTRDGYGNAVTVTDPRNHLTTYQYSPSVCSSAYVWKKIQIVGGQTTTAQSSYDCGTGLVIQSTNPRGYASDFTYDGVGRLLTVTYPAVAGVRDQVSYAYDDTLRTVTFFDELNDRARDGYDAFGRRISTQRLRDDGSVYSDATATYNWQGQIASQNSPEGVTTTYAYDLLGRLVKSTNDDGTHVDVAYQDTASGQRRTVTDEENHKRDFVYDLDGRVLQVTEYVGLTPYTTQYTYDDVGNLLSVADARSPPETTTQSYDDLNRVLQTNYPDSTVLVASYDENGNVIGRTDGTGSGVFTYDELNRLTNADYGNGLLVFDYAYDKNSNLVHSGTGGDPARGAPLGATVDYAYDERDRVSQEMTAVFFDSSVVCGPAIPSAAEVRTFSFGWTPDSNLAQLTYPDGRVVLYQYDDFDRPIVVPGIADSLGYNKDDQLTSLQFAHPVGVPAWLGEYTYDSRGRLASINYKKDSVSQLLMTYTYFSNSNIQQIINGGSLEKFTYHTRERFTQAKGSWGTTT